MPTDPFQTAGSCRVNHDDYVGKCPACHTKLPSKASPSPPPADQGEAAQVLYEKVTYAWKGASSWDLLSDNLKADWRAGVAALRRPVAAAADPVGEVESRAVEEQLRYEFGRIVNDSYDGHFTRRHVVDRLMEVAPDVAGLIIRRRAALAPQLGAGEVERLRAERDALKLQAECWAIEARGHKTSLHEAYQAVTGATGEPGNWNGARPIVDEIERLRAALCEIRDGLAASRNDIRVDDWIEIANAALARGDTP